MCRSGANTGLHSAMFEQPTGCYSNVVSGSYQKTIRNKYGCLILLESGTRCDFHDSHSSTSVLLRSPPPKTIKTKYVFLILSEKETTGMRPFSILPLYVVYKHHPHRGDYSNMVFSCRKKQFKTKGYHILKRSSPNTIKTNMFF